jgi:hypothetical protein
MALPVMTCTNLASALACFLRALIADSNAHSSSCNLSSWSVEK